MRATWNRERERAQDKTRRTRGKKADARSFHLGVLLRRNEQPGRVPSALAYLGNQGINRVHIQIIEQNPSVDERRKENGREPAASRVFIYWSACVTEVRNSAGVAMWSKSSWPEHTWVHHASEDEKRIEQSRDGGYGENL